MTHPSRLRAALWASHFCLVASAAGTVLTMTAALATKAVLLAIALLPLLGAVPGLRAARRYTYQWLTLLMVWYVGVAIVEVLAVSNRISFAAAALAAALAELALLLTLIRQTPRAASRG